MVDEVDDSDMIARIDRCIIRDRNYANTLSHKLRASVLWESTLIICRHLCPDNGAKHAKAVYEGPLRFVYNAKQLVATMKHNHPHDALTIDAMLLVPI